MNIKEMATNWLINHNFNKDDPNFDKFVTDLSNLLTQFNEMGPLSNKTFYNSKFGDDKLCKCGHTYYRHFDSYDNMNHIGCKYCPCFDFKLGRQHGDSCGCKSCMGM